MLEQEVTIKIDSGIHARPAAMFVKLANKFSCEIFLEKETTRINGKSIMGLMMLALTKGSTVTVIADGKEEKSAIDDLSSLLESDFQREDIL
jgi:phosphotransferase system HPr (HPr) family protein